MSSVLPPYRSNPGSLISEVLDSSQTNVTAIQRTAAFSIIAETGVKSVSEHLSLHPLGDGTTQTLKLKDIDNEKDVIPSTSLNQSQSSTSQPIIIELNGAALRPFESLTISKPAKIPSVPLATSSPEKTHELKRDEDELDSQIAQLDYNYNSFDVSDDGFNDDHRKQRVDEQTNSDFCIGETPTQKRNHAKSLRTQTGRPPEAGEKSIPTLSKSNSVASSSFIKSVPHISKGVVSAGVVDSIEPFVQKEMEGLIEAAKKKFGEDASFANVYIRLGPNTTTNAYEYLDKRGWSEETRRYVCSQILCGHSYCYH